MARQRSRLLDFATFLVVRGAICVVQMLPDIAAGGLARFFASIAYALDRRHRQVACENLRHAFPQKSQVELERMVRDCFAHFVALVFELLRLPRKLCVGQWRKYVTLVGGEKVVGAITTRRPAMIVTAHFGNWELAGFALGLLGFRTHAVARPLDNPFIDDYLRRFREKTGQRVLAKKGDFDRISELLASGGVLATLADQDAGQRGLFVDFFGRPASTHKAIALMAIEYDVPLVVVAVPKVDKPFHYHVIVEEVIEPGDFAGRSDAVRAITQRFTSALERVIRRYPEQYFWLHRRWKHQPPVRKHKAA